MFSFLKHFFSLRFLDIQKWRDLRNLLGGFADKAQRWKWVLLGCMTFALAVTELLTAVTFFTFAQCLGNPAQHATFVQTKWHLLRSPGGILLVYALMIGGTFFLKNILEILVFWMQEYVIAENTMQFRRRFLALLFQQESHVIKTRSTAFYQSLWNNDIKVVFTETLHGLIKIATSLILMTLLTAILFALHWRLGCLIFSVFGFMLCAFYLFFTPHTKKISTALNASFMAGQQESLDLFHGMTEITLALHTSVFLERLTTLTKNSIALGRRISFLGAFPRIFLETVFMGIFVFIVAYMGVYRADWQALPPLLGLYLYVGFRFLPLAQRLWQDSNAFLAAYPVAKKVHNAMNMLHAVKPRPLQGHLTFKKSLCLDNVSFAYHKVPVLHHVSLTISAGQRLGIVGKTGSGKTTLLHLIAGLCQPQSGSILVDGAFSVCTKAWQKKLGYVAQTPYLLHRSLCDNVLMGHRQTAAVRKRVKYLLELVDLHALIDSMPQGIDSLIGSGGRELSGGERQRLALARALFQNPEVLLLDEATSALDQKTETLVLGNMLRQYEGTVVQITHRPHVLESFDIIKIDKGHVIAA